MATRDFLIRILGDAKGLDAALDSAEKRVGALGGRLRGALGGLAAGFSVKAIIDASAEAQKAVSELDAVLASTGNTTGQTREQLIAYSSELQRQSTFGDEAILSAETILARFDTLGKETYPRALQATIDLGTKTGDLAGTAQRLGRALQSPLQGLSMLGEAGVAFTKQQQDQVKALVANGRTLEAQEVLLAGIERAYGGAAKAATETFGGAVTQLQEAFGDLLENPGGLQDNVGAVKDLTALLKDPATVQAANTLTGALFTGFSLVVELIVGSVNAVRDLSKEAALAISGGVVPIDEIDGRIGKLEARIKALRDIAGPEGPSPTGDALVIERIEGELAELRARRAQFAAFLEPRSTAASPASSAAAPADPAKPDPVVVDPQAAAKAATAAREAYALLRTTVEGQLALLRDAVQRELALIDQQAEDSQLSFAAATDARIAAQQQVIDAEIAARRQQAASATSEQDRAGLIQQITRLEAQRGDVAVAARDQQLEAEAGLREMLRGLSRDLQRATGDSLAAELADIEDRYRDTLVRLKAEGDAAGVSLVEQLVGAEQSRARLAEFERRASEIQQANAARQQSIANQRTAGVISERRAAQELIDANLATADSLRAVVDEYRTLAVAAGDTAALARIEELQGAILTLEDTTSQAARSIAQNLRGGLENVFKTAITDVNDLDSALLNLFTNLANQLAEQAGQDIVSSLFGEEGGSGDLLEQAGSLLSGDFSSLFGGGPKPAAATPASPLAGGSFAAPVPVTLVGTGGVGGGLFGGGFGAPETAGFGGGLLGAGGIGGSLFGGSDSEDPAALADTIGGDLVAAFDAATAAGAGLADIGQLWGGQGTEFAAGLADKLANSTGPAFDAASGLASSFFGTQQAGIASTTAASTAAAATTATTAATTNTAIAASAAPAAALTSIASFGGSAIAAAVAIPLVTAAIGALLSGAFRDGGIIDGDGTGTSDSNLALVSDGEAIIPAKVVEAFGEPFFRSLIDGELPAFASGGIIDLDMAPTIAGGGQMRLSPEVEARSAAAESQGSTRPMANPAPEVRINNIVDPSAFRNFLTSPDGARVVLNIVGNNHGALPGGRR